MIKHSGGYKPEFEQAVDGATRHVGAVLNVFITGGEEVSLTELGRTKEELDRSRQGLAEGANEAVMPVALFRLGWSKALNEID